MDDYNDQSSSEHTNVGDDFRGRSNALPWVLFGITAGVLVALTIVMVRQVSAERDRSNAEAAAHVKQTARADAAELALTTVTGRAQALERQVKVAEAERDTLEAKVKALESKAARAPAAPPPAKKAPAKKKASGPAKKKRR